MCEIGAIENILQGLRVRDHEADLLWANQAKSMKLNELTPKHPLIE
jgi:hypothetical protein